ncbi:MAG: Cytosol aminopeptidase PepA [Acidobacteriaceae bacterium]|nr:Cytosol aminopeptidase PepA [Acidobacteriaceae bacterium]
MNTKLIYSGIADVQTECLVAIVLDHNTDSSKEANPDHKVASNDKALADAVADVLASGDITGKSLETNLLHSPKGLKAKRLLIVGGGKAQKFSADDIRKIAGTAARFVKGKNLKSLAIAVPDATSVSAANAVRAIVEGVFVGDFDPNYYQSDRKDQRIDDLAIVAAANAEKKALDSALELGRVIGESQNFTRDLVNEPGNKMTPAILGQRAKKMSDEVGLKCEVFSTEKLHELKMGSFWSVSQGSAEPPALIVMTYEPKVVKNGGPVIGLVGKGVTFDTGGISIKPADGMEKMKYDMAGGAAMIGAMRAIALLKPNVKVIGIVCAAENMPSGTAQKPGDVQFAMNGKAIEIINTDAEGRLVLADGLCYARQLGCTHLVDAATLTGACVVALGYVNAGIFANNEDMYSRFSKAQQEAGEKFWRLPLDDEYREMIKSGIADIVNSGGRWGGAVTAAKFLQEFVDDKPWIHLDIAGVAWMEENKPWIAKGPSGIAVRSLVEFVKGW